MRQRVTEGADDEKERYRKRELRTERREETDAKRQK